MRQLRPNIFLFLAARWRVALLVCVTTLLWVAHYDRWTLESWTIPTAYSGDALEILARIKAAAEGDTKPLQPQVISRLGAPFGANWSAYPSSDLLLLWAAGGAARVIGIHASANLALLLAAVTSALSFYGCARWLRARWEWAFAGALLFAFTFQTFHRGLAHLLIVYSWTVPPALLGCGMVAFSRRIELRNRMGLFCIATAALIGSGNPYVLFLYIQLLGWALIAQWIGPRRRQNLWIGGIAIVVAVIGFFVVESHVWLYATDTAATSPIVRNYGATERYALKPIELFLPPAEHRWDWFAFFGQRYIRWSEWRTGEAFASYLGVVGIIGFLWIAVVSLRAVLRRQRLPGVALPLGWVLAFASLGGITNLIAFFTTVQVFRATNRYSIFISALVLLFVVTRMSWLMKRRRPVVSLAIAALVACVGLIDQLPGAPPYGREARIIRRTDSDRDFGARLERELGAQAMVFQLPVIGFPEVVPPFQLSDYEHFRPYLATSTLRFTYGSLKGRSRGRWQRELAEVSVEELVRKLESYGFKAIYLNRRGFGDRGETLLAELRDVGRGRWIQSNRGDQVAVFLKPVAEPVVPIAQSLTYGRGWQERPLQPRWSHGSAMMSFFNPHADTIVARLDLEMSSAGRRTLHVHVNDRFEQAFELTGERTPIRLTVRLHAGVNRIDLVTPQPAIRQGHEPNRLRAFAVHRNKVLLEPEVLQRKAVPGLPARETVRLESNE